MHSKNTKNTRGLNIFSAFHYMQLHIDIKLYASYFSQLFNSVLSVQFLTNKVIEGIYIVLKQLAKMEEAAFGGLSSSLQNFSQNESLNKKYL